MGKKDKKQTSTAVDTAADIDDIFAAPKKATKSDKPKDKSAKSSKDSEKADKSKGDKKDKKDKDKEKDKGEKKRKSADGDEPPKKKKSKDAAAAEGGSRVVEEVVDPSLAVKAAVEKAKIKKPAAKKGKEVEEDMAFRDSRGDAGREYARSLGTDYGTPLELTAWPPPLR